MCRFKYWANSILCRIICINSSNRRSCVGCHSYGSNSGTYHVWIRLLWLRNMKKSKRLIQKDFISILFLSLILLLGSIIAFQVVVFLSPNNSLEPVGIGFKLTTLSVSLTLIGVTLELRRRRREE